MLTCVLSAKLTLVLEDWLGCALICLRALDHQEDHLTSVRHRSRAPCSQLFEHRSVGYRSISKCRGII